MRVVLAEVPDADLCGRDLPVLFEATDASGCVCGRIEAAAVIDALRGAPLTEPTGAECCPITMDWWQKNVVSEFARNRPAAEPHCLRIVLAEQNPEHRALRDALLGSLVAHARQQLDSARDGSEFLDHVVRLMTLAGYGRQEIGPVVLQHPFYRETLDRYAGALAARAGGDVHLRRALRRRAHEQRAEWFQRPGNWTYNPWRGSGLFRPYLRRFIWCDLLAALRWRSAFQAGDHEPDGPPPTTLSELLAEQEARPSAADQASAEGELIEWAMSQNLPPELRALLEQRLDERQLSAREQCRRLGVSSATYYKRLADLQARFLRYFEDIR